MKSERNIMMLKKLKRGSPYEIHAAGVPLEKAIEDLARSAYEQGLAASTKQIDDVFQPPTDYLKALVSIATNAWRAKIKMVDATTGEVREEMKRVGRHIEAIYRSLADVGIVIRNHTGDAYDEGQPMKVVASKPMPGLDKKRVSETLLPSVFWNNRLVQNGEIEIATPASPNASAESRPQQL